MVVHQVDAWISGRDINPGQRWALALGHELAQSDFAIICLTSENRQSPWILFEAGAVARSLEARVVPLLFGITAGDLDGPLAQFQSLQVDDEPGIKRLVSALYDSSRSGLETRQRDLVFARLWPVLEKRLQAVITQAPKGGEIESSIDLVSDLALSSGNWPTTRAVEKHDLERLEAERLQLSRQLTYLNAEDEKLTQQSAPISLQRAIEPTEQRLAQVESTLETALNRAFKKLSPSQLALLRGLVTNEGLRMLRRHQDLSDHDSSDLEALEKMGLIAIDDRGTIITHDLVARYVAKRF
jgi:hypothetical protein